MNLHLYTILREGWPLLTLTGAALLSLLTAILPKTHRLCVTTSVAALGLAIAAGGYFFQWSFEPSWSGTFLVGDPFGRFLCFLVCLIGLVTTAVSYQYWKEQREPLPEFFLLILFSVLGMAILVSTTHLLVLVLGLEVMSLALYVLVGLRRLDRQSSEAAFKYFLLGSVATAFLLFGVSLLYGAVGSIELRAIAEANVPSDLLPILKVGGLLVLFAFIFKVAAVPFHFWAPDVYDGAPVPVTGFMAAGVKVAAFGALIRVIQALVPWETIPLQKILLVVSLATMVLGNLTALRQRSLKRIMAYSSISHAGYLLLGTATLVSGTQFLPGNLAAILFYLVSYSLLTLGAFAVLTALSSEGREIGDLADLDGLSEQHPYLAALLGIFLISLAGIPPTVGFLAKYYLFSQAMAMGFYLYAAIGILASAVSLYYYLGPIVRMYFRASEKAFALPVFGWGTQALLALMVAGVFYLGLMPSYLKVFPQTISIIIGSEKPAPYVEEFR